MDKTIQKLLHGFSTFHKDYFVQDKELFSELREGQSPKVLVIACSDSRVDPALLMNTNPGDIFVIRNIANLVPPYEPGSSVHHGVSAALEYSIKGLGVSHIVILGHSDCGGIKTLMQHKDENRNFDFIDGWLQLAAPAREVVERDMKHACEDSRCRACEEAAILLSLENLLTFPWIAERVEAEKLALHGWYFNLEQGKLYGFDAKADAFVPLH